MQYWQASDLIYSLIPWPEKPFNSIAKSPCQTVKGDHWNLINPLMNIWNIEVFALSASHNDGKYSVFWCCIIY